MNNMFSGNTDLIDKNIKKDVEDRLWVENYIESRMKEQYDVFMKGFYEKLSEKINNET